MPPPRTVRVPGTPLPVPLARTPLNVVAGVAVGVLLVWSVTTAPANPVVRPVAMVPLPLKVRAVPLPPNSTRLPPAPLNDRALGMVKLLLAWRMPAVRVSVPLPSERRPPRPACRAGRC